VLELMEHMVVLVAKVSLAAVAAEEVYFQVLAVLEVPHMPVVAVKEEVQAAAAAWAEDQVILADLAVVGLVQVQAPVDMFIGHQVAVVGVHLVAVRKAAEHQLAVKQLILMDIQLHGFQVTQQEFMGAYHDFSNT